MAEACAQPGVPLVTYRHMAAKVCGPLVDKFSPDQPLLGHLLLGLPFTEVFQIKGVDKIRESGHPP